MSAPAQKRCRRQSGSPPGNLAVIVDALGQRRDLVAHRSSMAFFFVGAVEGDDGDAVFYLEFEDMSDLMLR